MIESSECHRVVAQAISAHMEEMIDECYFLLNERGVDTNTAHGERLMLGYILSAIRGQINDIEGDVLFKTDFEVN